MILLLVQIAIVLLVAVACGSLARRFRQPRVVGEIIGGILIGPSVLGRLAPQISAHLFSKASFPTFDALSTLGLIFFLFLIGMELDWEQLYKQSRTVLVVSAMSILLPFAMASILAHSLRVRFAAHTVGELPFLLFFGPAMSITAFPVLARILEDRRLQRTALGTTAIWCAAINDLAAWLLLAFALAIVGPEDPTASLSLRIAGLGAYVCLMLVIVRPLAKRIMKTQKATVRSRECLGVILAGILFSAAATDAVGVHTLFGAFFAGVCFPRTPHWQAAIRTKLETIVSALLLPLFFAITGMRTRLDLLYGSTVWLWTGIVFIAAVLGKMGGAAIGARITGQCWKDAAALGALLNARGLVELIVLNVAYTAGVFTPTLLTMLVLMALVTTIITPPILDLLDVGHEGDRDGGISDRSTVSATTNSAA